MSGAHDNRRDREWLARLAAGSAEALAELYDGHAASLLRHAVALTRCRADAEDLVQTVFLKVATVGAELLGVRQPRHYLHRMVHTTWIDGQRRQVTGRRVAEEALFGMDDGFGAHGAAAENLIDIARALARLPEVQREAVVLHLVEGFSFREVGHLTGVSLFTAAARYRLAVKRLRQTLRPDSGDE